MVNTDASFPTNPASMHVFSSELDPGHPLTMRCKDRLFCSDRPAVMGIVNVTSDSFYEGSRARSTQEAVRMAGAQLAEGADIIDIGVMSSRPGAGELDESQEASLVAEVVGAVREAYPTAFISIDCYRARVASEALRLGAHIINDIGGGRWDPDILNVIADYGAGYVLMHSRSKPSSMTSDPQYHDLLVEIVDEVDAQVDMAEKAGVRDMWIDPGIGFSKTIQDNFALLKDMNALQVIGRPILVGLSRKSFIYKMLNTEASDALIGTTAMHVIALQQGASILRVHDVRPALQTIALLQHVQG